MSVAEFSELVERFGVAVALAGWLLVRTDRRIDKLTSKVNRLIIWNVVMSQTLELREEQAGLMDAISDEGKDA